MSHERLCPVCNTIFSPLQDRGTTAALTCSETCSAELRRDRSAVQFEDGDADFADDDLDGAFLENSRLSVDAMMAATGGTLVSLSNPVFLP